MGKSCAICGKTSQFINKVSHSNKKTRVKKRPNLQKVKAEIDGEVKKIFVCSKCLKAGKVKKVI